MLTHKSAQVWNLRSVSTTLLFRCGVRGINRQLWILEAPSSQRHLCLPLSHGQNPGGVSEVQRLFEKEPWEPGLMVMMVVRCERRSEWGFFFFVGCSARSWGLTLKKIPEKFPFQVKRFLFYSCVQIQLEYNQYTLKYLFRRYSHIWCFLSNTHRQYYKHAKQIHSWEKLESYIHCPRVSAAGCDADDGIISAAAASFLPSKLNFISLHTSTPAFCPHLAPWWAGSTLRFHWAGG